MNNPWASGPDSPQEADITWSPQWPPSARTVWLQADASWDPSITVQSQDVTPEQDITIQDQQAGTSQSPSLAISEPPFLTDFSASDHQATRFTSPPGDSFCPVPEVSDATSHNITSVAPTSDEERSETTLNPPDDDWDMTWATTSSSEADPSKTQPPDQWEAARQEKEKLNRALPPESLDSLLLRCEQVSQGIWPVSDTSIEDNPSSGFGDLADVAALLAQLLPADSVLPPTVRFSATATAKAMNNALKLTRHLPALANSPLSRLLASKGSLDWEKSIRAKQDTAPDMEHVGWRVLEKENRPNIVEESKPRKGAGGLLSFWNRRASAFQAAPVEGERPKSPASSNSESVKSAPHPPFSQAASPPKASTPPVPSPPAPDWNSTAVAAPPVPSAVSRFLNRFSRTKSAQHSSLSLSSDDLEFLSDITPSAGDLLDEDTDDGALGVLTGNSLPLPSELPPPIPPPPKQPAISSTPTAFQMQGANYTHNVPVLIPPLSPKPATSFSRTQTPPSSLNDVSTSTIVYGQSNKPSIQQANLPPPRQQVPPLLSIPPLLPPPPVSSPRTPRPGAFPLIKTPGHLFTMRSTNVPSFHDSHDSGDEFTAFTSFPSSTPAPIPFSDSCPSQRSPSPPSPPPRRTYGHTHYPSSSSTSSILSPAFQSSMDQSFSTGPPVSASLDSFDDFFSPPLVVRGDDRKCTPSPPPLPTKSQSQYRQSSGTDTLPSRTYHDHASSQALASLIVHTNLMNSTSPTSPVSDAEHRRTQSLVNHAAARGGKLWPNSPVSDECQLTIPPPPPSSTSLRPLIGEGSFDLLGNDDSLGDGLEVSPTPSGVVGGTGMNSAVSFPVTGTFHPPFGGGSGQDGSRNPPQPSPPLLAISTSIPSFSSLGTSFPTTATNTGSLQPVKQKQTGGLSAQDLSFFEGL